MMRVRSAWRLSGIAFALLTSGCGPRYYRPATEEGPGEVVASAYTRNGCLGKLEAEAKAQGLEVRWAKVSSGEYYILWPLAKPVQCRAEVGSPAKPAP